MAPGGGEVGPDELGVPVGAVVGPDELGDRVGRAVGLGVVGDTVGGLDGAGVAGDAVGARELARANVRASFNTSRILRKDEKRRFIRSEKIFETKRCR